MTPLFYIALSLEQHPLLRDKCEPSIFTISIIRKGRLARVPMKLREEVYIRFPMACSCRMISLQNNLLFINLTHCGTMLKRSFSLQCCLRLSIRLQSASSTVSSFFYISSEPAKSQTDAPIRTVPRSDGLPARACSRAAEPFVTQLPRNHITTHTLAYVRLVHPMFN